MRRDLLAVSDTVTNLCLSTVFQNRYSIHFKTILAVRQNLRADNFAGFDHGQAQRCANLILR